MKHDEAEPLDEDFAAWAAQCDEALRADQPATRVPESTARPPLPPREERFRACLQRLAQDRLAMRRLRERAPGASAEGSASTAGLPTTLGRFRPVRVLGRGGFGLVYLADDPRLGRQVALKVPRPEALLSAELRHRFVREAKAAARLDHPHVVPVFDSGEAGPFCYMVSAYCAGGSLAGWLERQKRPLSARSAAQLTLALAAAVQHGHERGVLHRDLKPGNVLLEPVTSSAPAPWGEFGFVPRVADFGLAKLLEVAQDHTPLPPGPGERPLAASATQTIAFVGTPAYMAPEQAEPDRGGLGPATDVYGLGAILYELLSGHPPFDGASGPETLRRVVEEDPAPLSQARRNVPRELAAICMKCLQKEPGRRYASAAALEQDLRAFLTGEPIQARPAGVLERAAKWARRRPAVAALCGVSAATVLTIVLGTAWYGIAQREHSIALQGALDRAESGERRLREENYAIQIKLADTMQVDDPAGLLGEILRDLRPAPGQEDLRGFEWHHLWKKSLGTLRLRGHRGTVLAVAISPNAKWCVSGDTDGVLRLWDLRTGDSLGALAGHTACIRCIMFSRDGRHLVTGAGLYGAGEIIVWEAAERKEVARLGKDRRSPVDYVAADPECRRIAFRRRIQEGNENSPIFSAHIGIWDWTTGLVNILAESHERFGHGGLPLAPKSHLLAAASPSGEILLWDFPSGRSRPALPLQKADWKTLVFAPDGNQLVLGYEDGRVMVSDLAGSAHRELLELRNHSVSKIAFRPDGQVLAILAVPRPAPAHKSILTLWDWPSGRRRSEEARLAFGAK